ncbi:spore germination protein [Bacillus piscicola]|uniref:spore germination protein n=1 Tax=Bacillus piscicola TaxID=1632684 RepID=UPI001F09B0F7|nr:spore germination protein [Bacillus piscicola]
MNIKKLFSNRKKFEVTRNSSKEEKIKDNLEHNISTLSSIFESSINSDFVIRQCDVLSLEKKASTFFLNGLVDPKEIEEFIINALTNSEENVNKNMDIEQLVNDIIPIKNIKAVSMISECVQGLNNGQTLLLVEGIENGFLLDTTKIEHRGVETPQNELVIKGSNEGFVESVAINKALIRKQLRYEKLVSDNVELHNRAADSVSLMYVNDLVDKDVVEDVKKRLRDIDVDTIQNIALLEQYLEERPYSLVPTILYTERPDRVVSYMLEGHVVILAENSPACLVVPVTFWSFFHTAEDNYQRWAYGNFIRIIRLLCFLIAIVTPSFYVAVTTFHIEMLPTDLALAIAAKRETIPFPVIVEVLIMEVAFEILREAGIRVPSPIGPTIGIVGTLILGQAAVEANIISPIMVIVVAITGLSSFAIPDISFSFMIRVIRFGFLLSAAIFGLFGIVICLTLSVAYLTTLHSFGVPFLSPKTPYNPSSKDLIFRRTIRKQRIRPTNINPQDSTRK